MVNCGVFLEVQIKFLNVSYLSFGFERLTQTEAKHIRNYLETELE
jgi:hypothetical protein